MRQVYANRDYLRFPVFDSDGGRHCVAMPYAEVMPLYLGRGVSEDDYKLMVRYAAKLVPVGRHVKNYSRTLHSMVVDGLDQGGFLQAARREFEAMKRATKLASYQRRYQADAWVLAQVRKAADNKAALLKRALASLGTPVVDRAEAERMAKAAVRTVYVKPKPTPKPAKPHRGERISETHRLDMVTALLAERDERRAAQ